MCGIAGWVGLYNSDAPNFMCDMQAALKKRGPDSEGIWKGERAVLVHTRLSIIDIQWSAQPMTNEDGSIIVIYNGEIYNYQDIRSSLIARGHIFHSQGDTEVLVHLYEEYGAGMVEYLDGMFAFGIYDVSQHSLLLARDRIGIKPLYYWHNQITGELLFASDMSTMLANKEIPRHLNLDALAQYLHFGYTIYPVTWLQEVYEVEPGQILEWENGKIKKFKYYKWSYTPKEDMGKPKKALKELYTKLTYAVSSHLVADVPVGTFLSGGLDSSTVTGLAQKVQKGRGGTINSFTVRFWLPEFDESYRARSIAKDLGTYHTEVDAQELTFTRNFIDRLLDGLGVPFGDTSALAVYLLCQKARKYMKVALSGDGGDEIFYGYTGLRKQQLARSLRVIPWIYRSKIETLTMNNYATLFRRLNKYFHLSVLDDPALIIDWHRRWIDSVLYPLLENDLANTLSTLYAQTFSQVRDIIGLGNTGGFLEQQIRFQLLVALPSDHLFKIDRMSMAHGLEVRVPMLSNNMLEYAQLLPLNIRAKSRRSKEPLRTLAESLSPTLSRPSPKRGFGFPLETWVHNKIVYYWREWGLTTILKGIGLKDTALDNLLTSYSHLSDKRQDYRSHLLSERIFDLFLLAVWMDNYQVSL